MATLQQAGDDMLEHYLQGTLGARIPDSVYPTLGAQAELVIRAKHEVEDESSPTGKQTIEEEITWGAFEERKMSSGEPAGFILKFATKEAGVGALCGSCLHAVFGVVRVFQCVAQLPGPRPDH